MDVVKKMANKAASRVLCEANNRANRKLIEMEKSHEASIAEMMEKNRIDSAEANRKLIEMQKSHEANIAEMMEKNRIDSAEATCQFNERLLASTKKKLIQCQKEVTECQKNTQSNKRSLDIQFEGLSGQFKRFRASEPNLALVLEEAAHQVRLRGESPDTVLQPFDCSDADDAELRHDAEACHEFKDTYLGQSELNRYAFPDDEQASSDRSPTVGDAQGDVTISGSDDPCDDHEKSFMTNNISYMGYQKTRGGVPKCPHSQNQGQRNSESAKAHFATFEVHKKKKWGRWVCGGCPLKGTNNTYYHCCWRTKDGNWIKGKTPVTEAF